MAASRSPAFGEMVRHDFRLARHRVGKLLFEHARNLAVQLLPPALEQALIGRIPHQRVLEGVDGVRRLAAAEHELRLLELARARAATRSRRVRPMHAAGIGKFAPDGGADLADLLHRRQAVEPRHQRILKRCRDGERRQRARRADSRRRPRRGCPPSSTALVSSSTNSGLPSVLATICLVTSAGSARPPATRATMLSTSSRSRRPSGKDADVGKTGPWRLEFRSEGEQCEHRQLAHPFDGQIEQLERRGIGPVRVLEQDQDRLLAGECLELVEQCRERPAALLHGTERQRRIALETGSTAARQTAAQRIGHAMRLSEERFELVEALLEMSFCIESRRSLQLAR